LAPPATGQQECLPHRIRTPRHCYVLDIELQAAHSLGKRSPQRLVISPEETAMPKSADKVIVTNQAALRTKYGAGFQKIVAAVNALVAADKKRGLTTKLVYLDSAADMKKLKAPRVAKATDPKQNKRAVDGVFKALEPD